VLLDCIGCAVFMGVRWIAQQYHSAARTDLNRWGRRLLSHSYGKRGQRSGAFVDTSYSCDSITRLIGNGSKGRAGMSDPHCNQLEHSAMEEEVEDSRKRQKRDQDSEYFSAGACLVGDGRLIHFIWIGNGGVGA
jgi:hypothetical protein